MFVPGQNQLLANLSLLLFFKDLSIVRFYDFKKNFRGMCFTVQLSKFVLLCRLSQTALLLYHVVSCLSRSFLTFRLISANSDILSQLTLYCQELFSFLFSTVFVSCNSDIIAFISVFVNYLLTFFYIFFYMLLTLSFLFQKTNCISDVLHRN